MSDVQAVTRRHLLTVQFDAIRTVSRVEIREVHMGPGVKAGLHSHSCPVVGQIVRGMIRFQLEGQEERLLKAGDAFFEPADVRVVAFDNASVADAAVFVAYYLQEHDLQPLITMLAK